MPTPITAPAILFQGQASAWQDTLAQAAQSPHTANRLRALLQEVKQNTAPLARELASTTPGLFATLDALVSTTGTARVTLPAVSIPGIVLGQIAALDHLQEVGINPATAQMAGHSQGSLGVAAVQDPAQALGIAVLMGTAAATVHGSHEQRPQMLSVRGASREFVTAHLSDATELAVINGPRHFVLSGTPAALAATQHNLEQQVAKHNAALEQRTRGGTELQLSFDLLTVALPFHHSSLQPAVELTAQYAATCGYSEELARKLAQEILVDLHDWPATVAGLKATHLLSLDERLSTITSLLIAGSGQAIVSAHTPQARDLIGTAGFTLPHATNYAQFAPKVVRLPNGNTYTQTRFTEWTGRSPIMLGGMTPTTVDAEIVAAAANAGFWTELAGGGMYSEEIFLEHKNNLTRLLAPGRAAQFNTMFFDRFMWNLQFGVSRIVPKARANGAPIDGVTISAGIPEPDEAAELLRTLCKEGFAHISFKPGTVEQIRACVEIAKQNPDQRIIVQIEDGHAGGHHSWVDLDEMLLETYAAMREQENIAIAVGGGFHSPQRAAEYLTGRWSTKHGMVQMPVDAVFVGTVAMACKEAKTSPQVKQLLVDTPGLSPHDNGGWVGRGRAAGGVASSQSHLLADLHELDNDFAAASRLITSLPIEEYPAHREEIIAALERTAKPYFGDVTTFTYAQWATRFAELAFPWQDPTWLDRWHELLQRIEARLHPQDHGPVETLFPTVESATDAPAALERLRTTYPQAETTTVLARDAAWFTSLHRKHPKPMPWTAALDADLKEWFGKDTLWQCHDSRYPASAVRVIPGPVSVAGITEANEPVAQLLQRFEDGTTNLLLSHGAVPTEQFARLGAAPTVEAYLRTSPTLVWHGRTISNPAARLGEHACTIEHTEAGIVLRVHADSAWDTLPPDSRPFHVAHVDIPVLIPEGAGTGAAPLVDDSRLPEAVFALLAGVAGVGSTSESGDAITALPTADAEGSIHYSFTLTEHLLRAHTAVTGAGLGPVGTPDVLVGPCWPAIYAALGTGVLEDGFPVIEGLLNAVHLDHVVTLLGPLRPGRFTVTSRCASIQESSAGRVVTVELELSDAQGTLVATQTQRFAIRGRAEAPQAPAALPPLAEVNTTPRSFMSRTVVKAPMDMTPFAIVSGDYNPIHTSTNAAKLVDLDAPLVHGMWLSATAQHQAATHGTVQAWTYSMYGMVQLGDEVEITVERVGRAGTQAAVEVTCRIEGTVVSQAQGLLAPKRTAYIYPGQGIQTPGMGQADRQVSPAARAVWQRADHHTTSALGFSIIEVVDHNPTTLVVGEQTFRHPQGVLHLTQFTQVALAVVAYAQTQRLREAGVVQSGSMYAGHSLGEYTALACMANIFDLEAVIDIVYSRGSAMATLVPRDANGESNYAMGALRPNMLGVAAEDVEEYVAQVARESGEFLEIVNYNIAGQQYSVAGTKAGLAALEARAAQVHERALVIVPGIDVPFHSRVLRDGVAAFAEKLNELLPATLDLDALVGRYIPNLVARPFELTQEFVDATAQLAPASGLEDLRVAETDPQTLARTLLIALLSWQFASPVRWIETQDVLFSHAEELLEVGLASSPTLTNLAKRSMEVRGVNLPVRNAERDLAQILMEDVTAAPVSAEEELVVEEAPAEVEAPTSAAPTPTPTAAAVGDLHFRAEDAILVLFAYQNKIRPEQITPGDTIEDLTNGVSSRRNQLLMDMSVEIGVPAIDGAAEADVSTLRERVNAAAPGYQAFGPVLSEAITTRLRQLLGASGLKPAAVEQRLSTFGLPQSWLPAVQAELLLGTREEDSVRGGTLATLPTTAGTKAEAEALFDAAIRAVADRQGVRLAEVATGTHEVVDSAALQAYSEEMTAALADTARTLLEKLGVAHEHSAEEPEDHSALFTAMEHELSPNWLRSVTPTFDPLRAVLFDDAWAQAREDLARLALGQRDFPVEHFTGAGEQVAEQAEWWATHTPQHAKLLEQVAQAARSTDPGQYAKEVALVTGAAPGSIAQAIAAQLLAGGATVIMTASKVDQARKEFARTLYATHARAGAALWLVPANLNSFRDVDALTEWIGTKQRESVGNEVKVLKEALAPTLMFPFAAPAVSGSLADAGPATETQARVLLWSVERMMAGVAKISKRCHVVLPGSPNRGMFGGDGAYGEVKAALDAMVAKWHSEKVWADKVTLAHAQIGWVAGTHLMSGNDALIPAVRELGVHVWDTQEIASELLKLATPEAREQATQAPIEADLTGGLGKQRIDIRALAPTNTPSETGQTPVSIPALPNASSPTQPAEIAGLGRVETALEDMVVIAGVGEVSSWGSGRTRYEAEYGLGRDGTCDLTAAGVLELAWMTGLVSWADTPRPGWYTEDGQEVPEAEIFERFRDEVVARSGIRTLTDKYHLHNQGSIDLTTVHLDRDITFLVPTRAEAEDILAADPTFTSIREVDGEWEVTRRKGATARVPRRATLSRTVAAQMPDGFDPANWGIPANMVDSLDRMAVWNLVTAIDAFTQAGFTPAELLQAVHPTKVATTQGTGIGGMESLHKVFVSRFLGEERPSDILQEALPNVIAAHTMQSLVGGYGSMIHPIGACATAAVSIEEGVDKIRLGKADVVIAGGIDDVQVESLTGFGDMNATAETAKMTAQGIDNRFISRANDRRRGGFLEGEGGGTVLLVRGSLAAELGLPVYAVVAHAASYGDGAHTSIPAPGLGALGAGTGGVDSTLARSLRGLGLSPNDVTVLSKHDTSTNANDPNESELHSILWPAIGRDPHQPMFVISQKTLTGHSKAGAALFQTGGIIDVFRTGRIPANVSLDCVDPLIAPKARNLVWLREPLQLPQVKAAALTSLGFGHVGALVVYAHPGVFAQAVAQQLGSEARDRWLEHATRRLQQGAADFEAGMIGAKPLFTPIVERRLPGGKEAEVAMLLDATARLSAAGSYAAAPAQ